MPGLTDLEENIARLERATEDARQATREAHEAVADLRRAEKAVRDLLDQKLLAQLVDEGMAEAIHDGLELLGANFKQASEGVYAKVNEQVDLLVNLSLGRPGKHGDLRPKLSMALRKIVAEEMGK